MKMRSTQEGYFSSVLIGHPWLVKVWGSKELWQLIWQYLSEIYLHMAFESVIPLLGIYHCLPILKILAYIPMLAIATVFGTANT